MPLLTFSPVGVQEKLDQLYNLTELDLAFQADEIRKNFKKWIKDNFELNAQQRQYLAQMNDGIISYYGEQCALSFLHRLDIILIYSDAPAAPGYSKWTDSSTTVKAQTNGSGDTIVTGTLTFTLSYQ